MTTIPEGRTPDKAASLDRAVFERMREGFVLGELIRDSDGRVTDWRYLDVNQAWGELVGIAPAHAIGRTIRAVFGSIEPIWIDEMTDVVDRRHSATFVRQVGTLGRWYEGRTHWVENDRFVVLFMEVTDRIKAEHRRSALIALDDRLRDMDEPAEMSFAAAEIIGRALGVSRAGYGVVDMAEETIQIDRDWTAPGVPSVAGRLNFRDYGSYIEDLKRGETVVFDDAETDPRTASNADALKQIKARSVINMPITERGGFVALLFLADAEARHWSSTDLEFIRDAAERTRVTVERRRAERDLRALADSLEIQVADRTRALMATEATLRQAQKMEAVGQLTGGLAHDFNNLLTGITGSLDMLQTRIGQGRLAEVERYVSAAQGAAKRAANLTQRLLAFSRRQTLEPKPTSVSRLVAGMEELIRRTVGPAISIEVAGPDDLWTTLVDPHQLENALLNLCINARDAMPDGGSITIQTANTWLDERGAREQDLSPGQYVSLCVSDTGAGMTPEVIARAFDPFFTTKPIGSGTGLGLSMVYGFVRQSEGQVRIQSDVGQGTTIRMDLPRHDASEIGLAEPAGSTVRPVETQGLTVLVVDDEPTIRMLVADVLGELGFAAIEASDGVGGLEIIRSRRRIDLLISDVGLPGALNGRQLADAARAIQPALKVLFITGYAENAVLNHGHLDPGMQVLTKPFPMMALTARIRDLLGPA